MADRGEQSPLVAVYATAKENIKNLPEIREV